jgi:hypothetical protein
VIFEKVFQEMQMLLRRPKIKQVSKTASQKPPHHDKSTVPMGTALL